LRTGNFTPLSERDHASIREFREFVRQEAEQALEIENKEQYRIYCDTLHADRTAPAFQLTPLSFEEFVKLMPEHETDATIRGLIATRMALSRSNVAHYRQKFLTKSLDDDLLQELGFDLTIRRTDGTDLDPVLLKQTYDSFRAICPEYDHDTHFTALSDCINTYSLDPNLRNLQTAFGLLWHLRVVEAKSSQSEPQRNPSLNKHGGNLRTAPDEQSEREQARKKYREEIVVTDPRDGKGWTQYMLDHVADAETYRRLVLGEHRHPKMSDVIDWRVK
jgi:hypothetical protein